MNLGEYLREIRKEKNFTLRDVERIAKEGNAGADLSSGYLSMLERGDVKEPSPRILFSLSRIYEIDYINLMKLTGYIPKETEVDEHKPQPVAFRGVSQLKGDQRERIQRIIDFELNDAKRNDEQTKD